MLEVDMKSPRLRTGDDCTPVAGVFNEEKSFSDGE